MKDATNNARQILDRFLGKMAEPISEEQCQRAASDVLERLRAEDVRIVSFPVSPAAQPRPAQARIWSAVAAGLLVILAGGLLHVILQQASGVEIVAKRLTGEIQIAGARGGFPGNSGIEAGKVVRAGSTGGAIALPDGSQVDMSPNAELSIDRETDGLRVRLAQGAVLVSAAKQRGGHLYVETKDCVVSVTGTVFAVSAEPSGSRVSVLEGEVRIHRGEVSKTLLAGQQATTSPEQGPLPAEPVFAWARERVAAAQQPATQQPAQAPQAPNAPNTRNTTGGSIVRGIVKATNGAGIPDVSVTLCPNSTEVKSSPIVPRDSTRQVTLDDVVYFDGPIVRNKTFFFGIWDNCVLSTVTTDSMGRFEFFNVAPGEYAVRAQREGFSAPAADLASLNTKYGFFRYWTGWASSTGTPNGQLVGDSMRVTVYAQQVSQDISLSLVRAGVIAGTVRDADGKPVVNARVLILGTPAAGAATAGVTGEGTTVLTTTTNDLGAYRAFWLLPGEYRVVAEGPRARGNWLAPAATATDGSPVVLHEGEEVSNTDIVVRPVADGAPVANPRR